MMRYIGLNGWGMLKGICWIKVQEMLDLMVWLCWKGYNGFKKGWVCQIDGQVYVGFIVGVYWINGGVCWIIMMWGML